MTDTKVHAIADADFETRVTNNEKLVLVDFMASWCGPCKQLAPVIEGVAEEFGDGFFACKLDVDQSPEVARRMGVRGLPTMVFMRDGRELHREVGTLTKTRLAALVEGLLA